MYINAPSVINNIIYKYIHIHKVNNIYIDIYYKYHTHKRDTSVHIKAGRYLKTCGYFSSYRVKF